MEILEEQELSDERGNLVVLLELFVDCQDDQQIERLKTKFYDSLGPRFYDRLKKVASRLYKGIPDWEARMEEVFSDTFLTAFEKLKTFETGDDWDDIECEKVLLNWLSTIANNKFLKLTDEYKQERKALVGYKFEQLRENKTGETSARKTDKQAYDKSKFDTFWNNLNPMSKEILLTCLDNGTLKEEASDYISDKEIELLRIKSDLGSSAVPKGMKNHFDKSEFKERNTDHLPDEALETLKTKYNKTSAAIRKAKQRALEGLRNCKI
jgi:DNA-directed RNA polymerase specialized sigma24 family protein